MSEAVWIAEAVGDIMHGTMPLVSSSMRAVDVVENMTAGQFGCVGVVDESGQLMGIITDGDLRRHVDEISRNSVAADMMTWHPITIGKNALLSEALSLMSRRKITVLFVVEENKPVGLVHIHDLIAAGA